MGYQLRFVRVDELVHQRAYALNDSHLLRRGTEVVHVFRAPPISSCYTRRACCCPNRPDGLATSNTTINSSDRARRKSASAGR